MKQLFLRGAATTLFFREQESFDDIFEWVQTQVIIDETNMFDLNEQYSCKASKGSDNEILISGDEDLVEITIETVTPINIEYL